LQRSTADRQQALNKEHSSETAARNFVSHIGFRLVDADLGQFDHKIVITQMPAL
jgi:hypothetical protein